MTRDDIIRMAREAGVNATDIGEVAVRFAALIASQEREACAKACYEIAGKGDAFDCMDAIRARGEKL